MNRRSFFASAVAVLLLPLAFLRKSYRQLRRTRIKEFVQRTKYPPPPFYIMRLPYETHPLGSSEAELPPGCILLFRGEQGQLPRRHWVRCNGTNGAPDLTEAIGFTPRC